MPINGRREKNGPIFFTVKKSENWFGGNFFIATGHFKISHGVNRDDRYAQNEISEHFEPDSNRAHTPYGLRTIISFDARQKTFNATVFIALKFIRSNICIHDPNFVNVLMVKKTRENGKLKTSARQMVNCSLYYGFISHRFQVFIEI